MEFEVGTKVRMSPGWFNPRPGWTRKEHAILFRGRRGVGKVTGVQGEFVLVEFPTRTMSARPENLIRV